ncbi:Riboflavin biosynthesis protein [Pandoraea iniqua]|uniref:Riboflavin biosynthesis protein n=1 Tax=Pandoraea iniqua TaxID=2508288 RepID=A0A5E4YJJ9_9BURK|nr:NADAR family protein [Pandoraea iniqua]VVE48565.1 Riboflavin biosynthesis protein [Pandoraea iniqua]
MNCMFDIESLRAMIRDGAQLEYLTFWGHSARSANVVDRNCLSQWYPASFELDGFRYPTAEHFMMEQKARLFGDNATAERILMADSAAGAKNLGREIKCFDEAHWIAARLDIVVRGNLAKFEQNRQCKTFLLETRDSVLVEASPVDRIWGIGIATDHPDIRMPERWPGLNLLGFALMRVRARLRDAHP